MTDHDQYVLVCNAVYERRRSLETRIARMAQNLPVPSSVKKALDKIKAAEDLLLRCDDILPWEILHSKGLKEEVVFAVGAMAQRLRKEAEEVTKFLEEQIP